MPEKKWLILTILTMIIILLMTSCLKKQEKTQASFSLSPAKPKPGETVTIIYRPDHENFRTASNLDFYAYSLTDTSKLPELTVLKLQRAKNEWHGTLVVDAAWFGAIGKFKTSENEDTNSGRGYEIPLYTESGQIVPGYLAAIGYVLSLWGQTAGFDRDLDKALSLTEQDFQANPNIKRLFFNNYVSLLENSKPEGWLQKIQTLADELALDGDLSDSNYLELYLVYARLGQADKANLVQKLAGEKFPVGQLAQYLASKNINQEKDLNKKIKAYDNFKASYLDSHFSESLVYDILRSCLAENKFSEGLNFLQKNIDSGTHPYYFYTLALNASRAGAKQDLALSALDLGLTAIKARLSNPKKYKPFSITYEEWKSREERNLPPLLLSLKANILLKSGSVDKAVPFFKQAYDLSQGKQAGIIIDYARALLELNQGDEAFSVLEASFKNGLNNDQMNDLLKKAYAKAKGSEAGWPAYQKNLENESLENIKNELKKKIVSQPAPEFELIDLEGKKFTLADFRGKTIVIDFWATWCGPCLSSFPAMKKLVEYYQADPSVKFVFINTWQSEENKEEIVRNFLNKTGYPFFVLLDKNDEVVNKFKVSGIPTKFVVDPNGRIRFISVGYDGNESGEIKKVQLMISFARDLAK